MNSCQEKIADKYPLVAIVDDDESVRESLPDLLREFGFATHSFSSAEEFLTSESAVQIGCLILDIAMPGMTGFDLQRELKELFQKAVLQMIIAELDLCGPHLRSVRLVRRV